MNTCDQDQVWTTDQCQNQDHPHLTVQNITFVDGNSKGQTACDRGRDVCDGGGAIWVGGAGSNGGGVSSIGVSWTIINSLFSYNRAVGNGGNPAQNGTPGGGSGG